MQTIITLAAILLIVGIPAIALAWLACRVLRALHKQSRHDIPIVRNERHAVEIAANRYFPGSRTEVVLRDGSRCDIVTGTHAIEADWCKKWKEAVGQAMLYSSLTGLRPGILILMHGGSKQRDLARLWKVAKRMNIDVWTFDVKKA